MILTKPKQFIVLVSIALMLFPLLLRAQKTDSMMNVYADNFPQEKVYVHFDKNIYNSGETVWFKGYVFAGAFPSLASRNFYAELTDVDGNLVDRKIYPLFESTASGNFDLPKNIKGNHLHFRAYTTWMMNFDTAFLYEKDIRIANAKKDSSKTVTKPDRQIQFFPEGGDLVAGLENNVAFIATDPYGVPISVNGLIKNRGGQEILKFNSAHDGMGKFSVNPDKGDSLYAVWKDDLGKEHNTGLPSIKNTGVVLKLIPVNKKILFGVSRTSDQDPNLEQLTIIGHMHQHLVYKAKMNLQDNFMSGGSIPVEQLPSGVLEVTVFNAIGLPLAERVVFVNNHDYEFKPEMLIGIKNLAKRGNNAIEITVPDSLKSNLSLAVTDALADGIGPTDDNIISHLLLTGDLKGYIHNPYYYFSNNSDTVANFLDLVMLTHGWRRFKWEQLAKGKTPLIKFPEQDNLSLKVEVLGVDPNRIAKDESMNAIIRKKDSSTQILQIPHLAGDKFGVTGLLFYDTAKVFYQFNINRKLSDEAAVTFNTGLIRGYRKIKPQISWNGIWAFSDSSFLRRNRSIVEEAEKNKSAFDQKVKTLEAVTVKGRQKSDAQKMDELYTSCMFSGGDAYTFDFTKDQLVLSYPDIFSYLQGKVAGLQISTTGGGGAPSMQWRGSTPTLYLNEMQIDPSTLQNTPVSDVAMVKIFRPGSGVGFGGGAGGVIAVYTKKGSENRRNDDSFVGLARAQIIGYSVTKEFYSPDYASLDLQNQAEDTRSTILWKPYILMDKDNHKVTLRFYNNDFSKALRVVLEGINEDGKLARIEKILQ